MKLVSIVIPVFNAVKYLPETVQSVMNQTYPAWEIIIVDDGSTDGSYELACLYSQESPGRVRVATHPGRANLGCRRTRLLGIELSNGEYIASLDADDMFTPDKLERQVGILDSQREVLMTFAPMFLGDDPATMWSSDPCLQQFSFSLPRCFMRKEFVPYLLSFRNDPAGALIRRSDLLRLGCYRDPIEFCEDTAAFLRLAMNGSVYIDDKPNYLYRSSAESWCGSVRAAGRIYREHYPFLRWAAVYLARQKCTVLRVWIQLLKTSLKYLYLDCLLRLRSFSPTK